MTTKNSNEWLLETFHLTEGSSDCERCPKHIQDQCVIPDDNSTGYCVAFKILKEVLSNGKRDS